MFKLLCYSVRSSGKCHLLGSEVLVLLPELVKGDLDSRNVILNCKVFYMVLLVRIPRPQILGFRKSVENHSPQWATVADLVLKLKWQEGPLTECAGDNLGYLEE